MHESFLFFFALQFSRNFIPYTSIVFFTLASSIKQAQILSRSDGQRSRRNRTNRFVVEFWQNLAIERGRKSLEDHLGCVA